MALKNGKMNPLNVLGARILNFAPEHFHSVHIDIATHQIAQVRQWIYNNLNGRFSITTELKVTDGNNLVQCVKIAFEDAKESTMFMLSCPLLDKK